MKVKEVSLKNFRSFERFSCEFKEGTNIILGENATGKTNILEGIFVFATAKSFRGGKDAEMIRFGENACESEIVFENRYCENRLRLCFRKNKSKLLLRNNMHHLIKKNQQTTNIECCLVFVQFLDNLLELLGHILLIFLLCLNRKLLR